MSKARREGLLDMADRQPDEALNKVMEKSYDSFMLRLEQFQVLYVLKGEVQLKIELCQFVCVMINRVWDGEGLFAIGQFVTYLGIPTMYTICYRSELVGNAQRSTLPNAHHTANGLLYSTAEVHVCGSSTAQVSTLLITPA